MKQTILADIIGRAAKRAGLEKHVTAHTLCHTAATWLHVDRDELHHAACRLERLATPRRRTPLRINRWNPRTPTLHRAGRIGRAVDAAVAGGGGGVEPPYRLAAGDSRVAADARAVAEWLSTIRITAAKRGEAANCLVGLRSRAVGRGT